MVGSIVLNLKILHSPYMRGKSIDVKKAPHRCEAIIYWWPGTESNCRHADFQSAALPTELPGRTA